MKVLTTLVGAAFALAAAAPASAVQLITNGNFEADAVGSTTITDWSVVTGAGDSVMILDGLAYNACCGATGSPAQLANKFVSFGAGDAGTNGIVSQSFATTASLYTVSFDVGAFGGLQILTASAIDTVTNAILASSLVTTPGGNDFGNIFATTGFTFASAGNAVRLSFTAAGSPTASRDVFLDNVSVEGAAVPEPATWALMVGGFALAGAAMRRRPRNALAS